ncbi:beta family protein [Streptomyces sp. NPDC001107]
MPAPATPSTRERIKHLTQAGNRLQATGTSHRCWIDTQHVEEDPGMVASALWGAFGLFTTAAPVTGPFRPPGRQVLADELAQSTGNGLALRVERAHTPTDVALESVEQLLARLKTEPEAMDLLLDVGALDEPEQALHWAVQATSLLGALRPWRTLVLLSGAFPASLQGLERDGVSLLPRRELTLWQKVGARSGMGERLVFGDYSIVHPGKPAQQTTGPVTILGRVLYSTAEDYLIVKGRSLAVYGSAQMPALVSRLTHDPRFRGRAFSEGERYLADCAAGQEVAGPPERFIRAGHTQHLTQTLNQLS